MQCEEKTCLLLEEEVLVLSICLSVLPEAFICSQTIIGTED